MGNVVAGAFEDAKEIRLIVLQEVAQRAVTAYVRIPAGQERGAAGRADGVLAIGAGEARAAGS